MPANKNRNIQNAGIRTSWSG